jgi:hypothetical protein
MTVLVHLERRGTDPRAAVLGAECTTGKPHCQGNGDRVAPREVEPRPRRLTTPPARQRGPISSKLWWVTAPGCSTAAFLLGPITRNSVRYPCGAHSTPTMSQDSDSLSTTNGPTDATAVRFDDFSVTADEILFFERAPALFARGIVALTGFLRAGGIGTLTAMRPRESESPPPERPRRRAEAIQPWLRRPRPPPRGRNGSRFGRLTPGTIRRQANAQRIHRSGGCKCRPARGR